MPSASLSKKSFLAKIENNVTSAYSITGDDSGLTLSVPICAHLSKPKMNFVPLHWSAAIAHNVLKRHPPSNAVRGTLRNSSDIRSEVLIIESRRTRLKFGGTLVRKVHGFRADLKQWYKTGRSKVKPQ
jgi:hypothetical protein